MCCELPRACHRFHHPQRSRQLQRKTPELSPPLESKMGKLALIFLIWKKKELSHTTPVLLQERHLQFSSHLPMHCNVIAFFQH